MQKAGIKHFRYSISWPRVLPQGTGAVIASVRHQCVPCKLTMLSKTWPCQAKSAHQHYSAHGRYLCLAQPHC